jgi:uncharacterized repeat protein (TIGR02543 family)
MKSLVKPVALLLLPMAMPVFGGDLAYPNGGEVLTQGTGCVITWDPAGITGAVTLDYSTNGLVWHPIATGTANDGAHPWLLPHETSAQYRVRVTDIDTGDAVESDAVFSVVSSSLKVQYPNDGNNDDLLGGRPIDVRWNSFGDLETVKIEYSYNNGSSWQTLTESTPNDGRHPWTPVPADYVEKALIRISGSEGSPMDSSDTPFEVYAPGPGRVTFTVTVPPLPPGEFVSIARGETVDRMTQIGTNQWRLTLEGFGFGETFTYRYCRNGERGAGNEALDSGYQASPGDYWREVTATGGTDPINDTVSAWRWWPGPAFTLDTASHESIPAVARPDFMGGMMLPDWWSSRNPWSPLIPSTLDWIVKGPRAGWVELVTIAEITSFDPPVFWGAGALSIPDEDFEKLVAGARARGLKVYLYPGEVTFASNRPPKPYGEAWWRAYASQWRAILLRWASLAEAQQVDMLGFRMWPSLYDIDAADLPLVDLLASQLLAEVRAVYSGKIAVDWNPDVSLGVFGQGDYLNAFIWDGHLTASHEPAVADLRSAVSARLDELEAAAAVVGKPVVFGQYTARSFNGAAGAIDPETLSESDFSAFQPGNPALVLDLQEQADVLEAMLHEITGRDWVAGAFNFGAFYWSSVDKDLNVRGKPAETVIAKWHRWLAPDRVSITLTAGEGGTTVPAPGVHIGTEGTPFGVAAVPDPGYAFAGWTGCGGGTNASCSLQPTGDMDVTAFFEPQAYTVSVTVVAGAGTFVCNNPSPDYGETATCTITPNAGYYLSALTDGGADILALATGLWVKTVVLANITNDHALAATFSASLPIASNACTRLGNWTVHRGLWTAGKGVFTSGAATDDLLVYGSPPPLDLLQAGTVFADVKLSGTSAKANAKILFAYRGKSKYRYIRLQPGKILIGQVGFFDAVNTSIRATVTDPALKLNTWYQVRLDLGSNGAVAVFVRPRGTAAWKKYTLKKFPSAVRGGIGLGAEYAASSFDNVSAWDPSRPPR